MLDFGGMSGSAHPWDSSRLATARKVFLESRRGEVHDFAVRLLCASGVLVVIECAEVPLRIVEHQIAKVTGYSRNGPLPDAWMGSTSLAARLEAGKNRGTRSRVTRSLFFFLRTSRAGP